MLDIAIVLAVCALIFWLIDAIGISEPFNRIGKIIVVVVLIVWLLGMIGVVPVIPLHPRG